MVSFLLIISFLLHVVAFIAIVQLYKQVQVYKKQEDSSVIMELFETYLQEIKEENNRLQAELPAKVTQEKYNPPQDEKINNKHTTSNNEQHSTYTPPESQLDDSVEASLQARILQLYNEGFSETQIAQKLNCGKTEAALVIKLHA